ncbi:MAG: small conductance mechanosensitive channel [Pseudohongiellaceae bacterium]|jgi:small conductance mechanosensitive channel
MDQELEQVSEAYNLIVTYLVTYSFQIFGAIVVLIIGFFVGRKLSAIVLRICEKKNLDITLSRFFASGTRIAIVGAAFVIALPKLGIQITPFVAALGAVGLGAGLAAQGLLSNYGAGLSIILTRPFVVGDTIRVQGVWGIVKEVHLAFTMLTNEDGEIITIPNKHIVGEIIHNSQADTVLELSVGIAYESDTKAAIEAIRKKLADIDGLSQTRSVQIGIDSFGDSSINLEIRCWVKTEQLYEVKFSSNQLILDSLKEAGVQIPFPQREVRMMG